MAVIDRIRPPAVVPEQAARPARRRISSRTVLGIVVTLILVYLIFGPLAMLLVSSAQDTSASLPLSPGSVWSFTNYRQVFGSAQVWKVLGTTVEYAIGALIVAGVLSSALAWLIERTDIPMRRTLYVLVVAGSGIPGLVFAISWSLLLNPTNGVLNQVLHAVFRVRFNVLSLPGMILIQGIQLVPLMFLLIGSAFRNVSGSLEDAAATSGARTRTTMIRITLPLLAPALLGALVYNLVNVIEWVDIPLVLGLPGHVSVLATRVYLTVQPPIGLPNYGLASTYGFLLVILSVIPLLAYNRLIRRSSRFATITGKGYRPRPVRLGRARVPAAIGVLAYVFLVFVLPFAILIWASTQPYYSGISRAALHRATLKGWSNALHSSTLLSTVGHTILLGVSAAVGTMILSLATSWLVARSRTRAGAALDFLSFLPHMIPSVVVGLAILLVYLFLPLSIYGTIWIIVIAMITKYVALGTRLTTPGVGQVHISLEEAAATSGGRLRHTWRRVLLPLLRPVLTNGFLIVFLASVQNLTLALLLFSPGSSVLATEIWNRWDYGDVVGATVLSVIITVITLIVATALRAGGNRDR